MGVNGEIEQIRELLGNGRWKGGKIARRVYSLSYKSKR